MLFIALSLFSLLGLDYLLADEDDPGQPTSDAEGLDTLPEANGGSDLFESADAWVDVSAEVEGTQANDSIVGGDRDQRFSLGAGDDVLEARGGDDTIAGGNGRDLLYGGGGDDRVFGGISLDTIYGGDGNDTIFGRDGNDRLFGGQGDDLSRGDLGNDRILDALGRDTMVGGEGSDTIIAADRVLGESDRVLGAEGNDVLLGDDGDTLVGGLGEDEFRIQIALQDMDSVVVKDFWDGEESSSESHELIYFLTANGGEMDSDYLADNISIFSGDGDSSLVLVAGKVVAVLQGVSATALTSDNSWIGNYYD